MSGCRWLLPVPPSDYGTPNSTLRRFGDGLKLTLSEGCWRHEAMAFDQPVVYLNDGIVRLFSVRPGSSRAEFELIESGGGGCPNRL